LSKDSFPCLLLTNRRPLGRFASPLDRVIALTIVSP